MITFNQTTMKQLAIYHCPQEYGDPYVLLINLENGQELGKIIIPNEYLDSGLEVVEYYEPTGDTVTRDILITDTEIRNFLETSHPKGVSIANGDEDYYTYGRDKYLRVKCIEDTHTKKSGLVSCKCTYEVCRRKSVLKFDASKDTFRKVLEEQGIDMTGWCIYKRRKTDFMEFLKAILPDNVVNIICI